MKIKLLLVFLLCCTGIMYGQAEQYKKLIDSLEKKLPGAKADTLKVKMFYQLSENWAYSGNAKKGFYYCDEALELATTLKWKKGISKSHAIMARLHEFNSDRKKSHENVVKALNVALETKDTKLIAEMYEAVGLSYWNIDYAKSLAYLNKSIKLYKSIKSYKGYNGVLLQKGGIYSIQGKYYEAADCFREIMLNGEKAKDTGQIITGSNYLAGIYNKQGNTKKALEYYLKASRLLVEIKNESVFTAFVIMNVADIHSREKEYQKAIASYNKALGYIKKSINRGAETNCLLRISAIYTELKDNNKARDYFDKAHEVNESNSHKHGKMEGYLQLGEAQFSIGNFEEALKYHTKSLKICEEMELPQETAVANGNIGATYIRLANKNKNSPYADKAVHYLEKATNTLKALKSLPHLELYLEYLSEAYDLKGESAKALVAYKEYVVYRDSIYDKTKRDEFAYKQSEYEYGKKEALLRTEQAAAIEHEKNMRNFSYAGIGILIIVAGGAGLAYKRKKKDNTIIARERQRSEDLLLNILPHEVAEELKEKGEASAQYYDHVSILFTDFEGFTKLSEKMSPKELIGELNYCFKAFDQIISKYNIEKIKTIGDAYMAVSGLPSASPDHAMNVVRAAIEIRDFMLDYKEQRRKEGKVFYEMRIGINSGEVVAGIVGIKKFAYDIWGDAVNIAARMESNGQVGKINISESTYALVKDAFDAEYRGEIDAKGKGEVKMYFVEPKQIV